MNNDNVFTKIEQYANEKGREAVAKLLPEVSAGTKLIIFDQAKREAYIKALKDYGIKGGIKPTSNARKLELN